MPYCVGSAAFLIGAWIQLIMWKSEKFGLKAMSEMNRAFVAPNAEVKGWRWVEQLVFTMYFSFATLAVLNIGLVLQWNDYLQTTHALNGGQLLMEVDDIVTSAISFTVSHSLLLLGTVVHATPSLHPFDYLLILMRGVSGLFCLGEIVTFAKLMVEVRAC
mmetsp:Transcript_90987/g.273312  ORF Transcript_90987/g.273312 Transcript_90987/m.273312 type:complete len:160 (+) Transcript_90987:1-480(+)